MFIVKERTMYLDYPGHGAYTETVQDVSYYIDKDKLEADIIKLSARNEVFRVFDAKELNVKLSAVVAYD